MKALYLKALIPSRGSELPAAEARAEVQIERDHLAAYDRVCGFRLRDVLPATYPHMLAFPLSMELMTSGDFPFPVIGMVHVRNRIEVLRPIGADALLDLEVWAENFATHRSGATVDLCASVSAGGAEVWRGRSTYLARGAQAPEGAPAADIEVAIGDLPEGAIRWRVDAGTGRRYAGVSGDVNPIHLSGLTAKAFGFKRAIAHGMWVKAHALAALEGRLPAAMTVDVGFRKPLFLPSTVTLSTAQADGGWDVAVRSATSGTEHLIGTIRPR